MYYGSFMGTTFLGLGRMRIEWLYIIAKIGLKELPPPGLTERQPLDQDGLVGVKSTRVHLPWRIRFLCARDEINQTLFSMHCQCQQQGSGPVLFSSTMWQGEALPAGKAAKEQTIELWRGCSADPFRQKPLWFSDNWNMERSRAWHWMHYFWYLEVLVYLKLSLDKWIRCEETWLWAVEKFILIISRWARKLRPRQKAYLNENSEEWQS